MSETTSVRLARTQQIPSVFDMLIRLSIAEKVALAFFAYITLAAFVFHPAVCDLCILMTLNAVTLATVYGRYHYAADAEAGALVGVAANVASNAIKHRAIE